MGSAYKGSLCCGVVVMTRALPCDTLTVTVTAMCYLSVCRLSVSPVAHQHLIRPCLTLPRRAAGEVTTWRGDTFEMLPLRPINIFVNIRRRLLHIFAASRKEACMFSILFVITVASSTQPFEIEILTIFNSPRVAAILTHCGILHM